MNRNLVGSTSMGGNSVVFGVKKNTYANGIALYLRLIMAIEAARGMSTSGLHGAIEPPSIQYIVDSCVEGRGRKQSSCLWRADIIVVPGSACGADVKQGLLTNRIHAFVYSNLTQSKASLRALSYLS